MPNDLNGDMYVGEFENSKFDGFGHINNDLGTFMRWREFFWRIQEWKKRWFRKVYL